VGNGPNATVMWFDWRAHPDHSPEVRQLEVLRRIAAADRAWRALPFELRVRRCRAAYLDLGVFGVIGRN